jgi:hypothetical protein
VRQTVTQLVRDLQVLKKKNLKMDELEILKSKSGKLKLDEPSGDAGPI